MECLHFGRKIRTYYQKSILLNCEIQAAVLSDVGCTRSKNEDNYIFFGETNQDSLLRCHTSTAKHQEMKKVHLAGVFDGIAGGAKGEIASKIAAECVRNSVEKISTGVSKEKINCIIRGAFLEANNQITLLQKKYGFAGTTATVLVCYEDAFKIYHLGDSRAYLFRQEVLYQITTDHTLSNKKIETGIYSADDPCVKRDKHKLMRFIGKDEAIQNMELEESEWISIAYNDQILLCSDGLYDMCSDNEISCVIQKNKSAHETVLDLISCAKNNGGDDNITCLLIKYNL